MRRYKFRGKSTDTKEWLVGALVPNGKRPCIAPFGELFHLEEVSHETVGQFVELTDRNKREVYEGDILKWKEYDFEKIGIVIWSPSGVFIGRPREHGIQCIGVAATIKETEVIGNIHDNPELLKGGTNGTC